MLKIKSTKWYGAFWPPERKKIKIMQALIDYKEPEIRKRFEKAWRDHLLYGKPMPTPMKPLHSNKKKG